MSIPNPKPWTYELYALLPEDGKRHEIIDGEHLVTPAPKPRHQKIVVRLISKLDTYVSERAIGTVLAAPCDVYFTETDNVQPDVLFVSKERESIIGETRVEGAPDLLIEVLSPSTRKKDEVLKRDLYERFGVQEYWIVDPELETVKVFRQGANGFNEPTLLAREKEHSLETPLLPAFSLSVGSLF